MCAVSYSLTIGISLELENKRCYDDWWFIHAGTTVSECNLVSNSIYAPWIASSVECRLIRRLHSGVVSAFLARLQRRNRICARVLVVAEYVGVGGVGGVVAVLGVVASLREGVGRVSGVDGW